MSAFHQELRQRQSQQLVLAPQLRQSLKILQVAALDLQQVIQEELQQNPALEELPMDSISLDEPGMDGQHGLDGEHGPNGDSAPESDELKFEQTFEVLNKLDDDWRDYMAQVGGATPYTSEDAERRQRFFDSLVTETSLQQHLLEQAELQDISAEQLKALEYLVGSLDNRGFLTASLADVALLTNLPLSVVQQAHAVLKGLDPPGIGCFDLRDCLLEQLKLTGRETSVAAAIIRHHFDLLARRRIPDLARKLDVEVDEVQHAIEEIARLDPAPARAFAEDTNRAIIADVIVEQNEGEWIVTLNSDYIPRLRLSQTYKEMIARGGLQRQEKDYLLEKMRSGKFLINSIEQRQQTIERISREILRAQLAFFEEGVSKLRPLTMTQVADAVGVHETTVSRAIANKYMQTPHGIFEMKFFFTPGYQSADGAAVSNTSVKEMIAHLISGEDPSKPLSDQEIVARLEEKNLTIARRTVAKYREELGILPSNLRREYS
jgi:RNA polymerase sigma-54 factor